jgi:hypothetical protein
MMLEQPALYVPSAGAAGIECTLCRQSIERLRFGDKALLQTVELRLLLEAGRDRVDRVQNAKTAGT